MSPPPTDEELELKQHVIKALTSQGVLGKLKAQLRAAVFHVMHEHELQDDDDDALLATRRKLQKFGEDGGLALAIVLDFLAFSELEHSLAVLKAEVNAESGSTHEHDVMLQLAKLRERLEVSDTDNTQRPPLLIEMLLLLQKQSDLSFGIYKERMSGGSGDGMTSRDERMTDATSHHKQQQDWEKLSLSTARRDSEAGFGRGKADENDVKDAFMRMKLNSERPPSSAVPTTSSGNTNTKRTNDHADEAERSEGDDDSEAGEQTNKTKSEREKAAVESDSGEEEDEIASGSELNESIAEEQSASLNYSQDYESTSKDFDSDLEERALRGGPAANATSARAAAIREEEDHDAGEDGDSSDNGEVATTKFKFPTGVTSAARDEQESDDEAAPVAATVPPPVPTKLPSLPPMAASNSFPVSREPLHDDDEFDAELEAARLSSLDAKLKAMEAEDETGTLQQLKASLQMELQHDELDGKSRTGGGKSIATTASDKDDEEHDGYGSDFEEEEVISEVSDDEVGSMSDLLSDNDESQVLSTLKQPSTTPVEATEEAHALYQDKAVADENALNSYDYIEEVERDW